MAEHAAKTVTSLWAYIGSGRPIAPANRVTGFVSCDEATWVSWWAPDEVETLLRDLPGPSFATSDFTEGVLASVHCALNHAASKGSGLVITAF